MKRSRHCQVPGWQDWWDSLPEEEKNKCTVLDTRLTEDPKSEVACGTATKDNMVIPKDNMVIMYKAGFSDVLLELTECADAWSTARADATCICFKLLDIDHDGYLNWQELYVFAKHADFKGGPVMESEASVWAMEYESISENYGANVERGLELGQFGAMVDGESETGCHCFTQELKQSILTSRGIRWYQGW